MPVKVADIIGELKSKAEELGLPFGNRTRTYNSRLAQELGLWAEKQGRGDRFHQLAFRAYFAEGSNLARRQVLLELARETGLPLSGAKEVLDRRLFSDAVDADWRRSRDMGITAVPTFAANGRKVVGAQPYAVLEKLIIG